MAKSKQHQAETGRSAAKEAPAPPARQSASLILLSPLLSPSSDGFDYKVCLLKRNSTMAAAASATVFPGGNLDEADTHSAALFESSEREEDVKMTALKICALRETFEETGLLVLNHKTKASLDKERLSVLRKGVYGDAKTFPGVYEEAGKNAMPPLESLIYWSRWITPVAVPKRFDTAFFLHILPISSNGDGQSPLLVADGSESLSAEWTTPREAITACVQRNEISFLPPQLYLLAELARLPTIRAVEEHSKTRKVLDILPRMRRVGKKLDGLAFVYPGDEEYDGRLEDKGGRHRGYVLSVKHEKKGLVPVQPPQVRGLHRLNVEGLEDLVEGNVDEDDIAKSKL